MIICEIIVHLLVILQNKLYSLFVNGRPVPNQLSFCVFLRLPVDGCIRQPKHVVAQYNEYIIFVQHVNRMPRNRLPRVMKHYSPTGRRNHGRPLKRLLDT